MQTFWWTLLNHLAVLLVQLLVISALVLVHRYQPLLQRWLVQHTSAKERELLRQLGQEAYWLAEQTLQGAQGQQKLNLALQYLTTVAGRSGLQVSPDELRAAVEQAVIAAKRLNAQQDPTPSGAGSAAAQNSGAKMPGPSDNLGV